MTSTMSMFLCCCCCLQVQAETACRSNGATAELLDEASPLGETTAITQEQEQEVRIVHCVYQHAIRVYDI
jgi:hypothetical protein